MSDNRQLCYLFTACFHHYFNLVRSKPHGSPVSSSPQELLASFSPIYSSVLNLSRERGLSEWNHAPSPSHPQPEPPVVENNPKGSSSSLSSASETMSSGTCCNPRLTLLSQLLCAFRRLDALVEANHLLPSSNETLEDMTTTQLKYLTIPFVLGELFVEDTDMKRRMASLNQAKVYFESFMSYIVQLRLGFKKDLSCWEYEKKPKDDLPSSRINKIERSVYQTELDVAIQTLMCSAAAAAAAEGTDGSTSDREEIDREWIITILKRFSADLSQHLEMIEQELPLLERFQAEQAETPTVTKKNERDVTRVDLCRPKPVVLDRNPLKIRAAFQDQVFQPGHRLPTMTLAECAEYEMKFMAKSKPNKIVEEFNANEFCAKELEEEKKARAWDDWKDEHPKGSGNKMKNVG